MIADTVRLSLDQRRIDPKYLATECHRRMLASLSYIHNINLEGRFFFHLPLLLSTSSSVPCVPNPLGASIEGVYTLGEKVDRGREGGGKSGQGEGGRGKSGQWLSKNAEKVDRGREGFSCNWTSFSVWCLLERRVY